MQPWLLLGALAWHLVAAPVQVLRIGKAVPAAADKRSDAGGAPTLTHDESRVRQLVGQAVQRALPPGWLVGQVTLQGLGRLTPRRLQTGELRGIGAAKVDVRFVAPLAAGEQQVAVAVVDGAGRLHQMAAAVMLTAPNVTGIAIKRGAEVNVAAHSGSIRVQMRGIAQSSAAVGEQLVVLCDNATRTLVATVVGPKEVEVQL